MNKNVIFPILLFSLLLSFSLNLLSQNVTSISPYISLQYFKYTDDQSVLQTTLTYSSNRMELPLPAMEILFFAGADKKELIGKILTDNKGIARLELTDKMKVNADRDGEWAFSSEYRGNDTIESGSSELTVKDVKLEMVLLVADTVETITVKAFTLKNGKESPVSGEVVKVYVPRMFSLLPISELTLDESGTATGDFPSDLPGDKEGKLTLIAKFEENETFGNVEKRETLLWGTPTDYSVPVTHRALWTKIAPRWMIYTLSILLAGVWGHYLYALISLIRIRNNAKREAKNEYKI